MPGITLSAPRMFDLAGQVALVTGAGSGIGQRIALGLAQCGADVALLDWRPDDGLAQTAALMAATGRRSVQITADVTSGDRPKEGRRPDRGGPRPAVAGRERRWHRPGPPNRHDLCRIVSRVGLCGGRSWAA